MKSMNKVLVLGHIGNTPERLTSQKNSIYTRLNVATNRSWLDDQNQWQTRTDWHYVICWGKEAENCVTYLTKGSLVLVEGYLSTYESKVPDAPKSTVITAEKVRFLSRGNGETNRRSVSDEPQDQQTA